MTTAMFLRVTAPFKSKVVGHLPKEFIAAFNGDGRQAIQFLNEFSDFTKKIDDREFLRNTFNDVELSLSSGKKIRMGYLGEGSFGRVLKLTVGEKSFAFKSFFTREIANPSNFLVHGAVAETRTNAFLSDNDKYKDYVHFHIANFSEDNKWSIAEYIDKNNKEEREGVKLQEAHPDLELCDAGIKNNVGNEEKSAVRVDTGGIVLKKMMPVYYQLERFRTKTFFKYLNHPDLDMRSCLPEQLYCLPTEDIKKAFSALLEHPDPNMRKNLGEIIWKLPRKFRVEAFYTLLNHPDPNVHKGLTSKIAALPLGQRTQVFYDVLKHKKPEVREGISECISFLPEEDRKKAFYTLLHHHPEARKGLASQVGWLLQEDSTDAFCLLLNHQDPEVRKGLGTTFGFLSEEVRKDAFYALLNHQDPEVRKGIAWGLSSLPEEDRKEAFYALLNHQDPEVHKGLGVEFSKLPKEDIKEALYALLKHPDPEVRKGIGSQMWKFGAQRWKVDSKDAQEVVGALIKHPDPEVRKDLLQSSIIGHCKFKQVVELLKLSDTQVDSSVICMSEQKYTTKQKKIIRDLVMKKAVAPYKTFGIMVPEKE